jgi:hypothetical protein
MYGRLELAGPFRVFITDNFNARILVDISPRPITTTKNCVWSTLMLNLP